MDKKKAPSWEEIHRLQIKEILKHKWILSEREGRDLGEEAVMDWIENTRLTSGPTGVRT